MRPIAALLTSVLVLAVCCSSNAGGAEDPRKAVDTYLAALNHNDETSLRTVLPERQREQARTHLSERGGKALQVETVHITQDFGPKFAFAHVLGTDADGSRYDERLVVSWIDERWYVNIPWPIGVDRGGKPTSAVSPATSATT